MSDDRGVPDSVKIIQVIVVIGVRGEGTNKNPVRHVTQYWSLDGQFLAEANHLQDPPGVLGDKLKWYPYKPWGGEEEKP